jgi:hypothetical protein
MRTMRWRVGERLTGRGAVGSWSSRAGAAGVAAVLAALAPAGVAEAEAQPVTERPGVVRAEVHRAQEQARAQLPEGWFGMRLSRVVTISVDPLDRMTHPPRDLVHVTEVVPGGPAELAGVRVDDLVLRIAGKTPHEAIDDGTMARLRPGDQVEVLVEREGVSRRFMVRVGRRPPEGLLPQATVLARTRADSVHVVVSMQLDSIRSDLERARVAVAGMERDVLAREMELWARAPGVAALDPRGLPPGARLVVQETRAASPMIRSFVFVDSLRAQLSHGAGVVRGTASPPRRWSSWWSARGRA